MNMHEQIAYWKHRAEIAEAKAAVLRDPRWVIIRRAHILKESDCQACGGKDHLEVHHIQSFHEHPELELLDPNLITLCEAPGKNCHLRIGHNGDWHKINPNVRADAIKLRSIFNANKNIA